MRIGRITRLLIAGLALAAAVEASGPFGADVALSSPTTVTLASGLRVIVERRPGSRTFALGIEIAGGTCEDPAGQPGASSLLARMLLRSSETTGADERALRLESAGVTFDGSAGVLGLEFAASGPAEAFDGALALVADALLHPRFDPAEIVRETTLARQAIVAQKDDPYTTLRRTAMPLLYGDHCLARLPPEDPSTWLAGVGPDALRALHRERFTRSRVILAVAGDVHPASVEQLAGSLFDSLPAGFRGPAALAAPRPLAADQRARAHRRTSQPEILVAMPTAGIPDADAPAMSLLAHILGGFQERLSTEIREKRGWAYWVSVVDWRWPGAGGFGVITAVPRKHLAETEAIIRAELARIADEPPSPTEVERARRFLATQRARSSQSSAESAARLARNLLQDRPLRSFEEEAARDAAVTPAEVSALARRLLDSSHLAVVELY